MRAEAGRELFGDRREDVGDGGGSGGGCDDLKEGRSRDRRACRCHQHQPGASCRVERRQKTLEGGGDGGGGGKDMDGEKRPTTE